MTRSAPPPRRRGRPTPARHPNPFLIADPATDDVPPRRARRRAIAGRALVVGVYLVIMGGLALVGDRGWLSHRVFVLIGVLPTYLMAFIGGLDNQRGAAVITPTRLTVTTATGRRTLDLTALRRVRRLVFTGKYFSRVVDVLYVTDARGVRAGLKSADAVRAVARAARPSTRVNRRALWRLAGSRESARFYGVSWLTDSVLPVFLVTPIAILIPAVLASFVYGW